MFVIFPTVMTYMHKNKNLLNSLWYIYTMVYIYLKGWRPIYIAIKVLQHIKIGQSFKGKLCNNLCQTHSSNSLFRRH